MHIRYHTSRLLVSFDLDENVVELQKLTRIVSCCNISAQLELARIPVCPSPISQLLKA